jgi:hypothetical protein
LTLYEEERYGRTAPHRTPPERAKLIQKLIKLLAEAT